MSRNSRERWVSGDAIPTHVRRFHLIRKSRASAGKDSESEQFGSLFAAFEHPLQAQANAQHRLLAGDCASHRGAQSTVTQRPRSGEIADSGNDQLLGIQHCVRITGHDALASQVSDGLHHRGQIPRAVIEDGNHKSPFVLGSMRPSWRSLEQATRKARANALNSASILW